MVARRARLRGRRRFAGRARGVRRCRRRDPRRARATCPRPALAAERPDLPGAEASGFYATLGALDLHARVRAAGARRARRRRPRSRRHDPRPPGARSRRAFEPAHATADGDRAGAQRAPRSSCRCWPGTPASWRGRRSTRSRASLTYWIEVLRALARPDSFMRQVAPGRRPERRLVARRPRPAPARAQRRRACRHGWRGRRRWRRSPPSRSRGSRRCTSASARGRVASGATYFAEKLRNDIVSDLAWELYPDAREVVLVRDPRDVLCSCSPPTASAASARRPPTRVRWIGTCSGPRIDAVAESWSRRRDRAHLVRYEDLMLRPARDAHRRARIPRARCRRRRGATGCWRAPGGRCPAWSEHRTTPDAQASIGRWRGTSTRPCWRSASACSAMRSRCSATRPVAAAAPDRLHDAACVSTHVGQGYRWRGRTIFRRPRFLLCASCNEFSPDRYAERDVDGRRALRP